MMALFATQFRISLCAAELLAVHGASCSSLARLLARAWSYHILDINVLFVKDFSGKI